MKNYIRHDEWSIIEEGFHSDYNRITESLMSLGNGRFGQRANFEEQYTGDTLQGNYVAGVYYPDKTKVGWWKIGYPESFAKVLNSANWVGIDVSFEGEQLDLAKAKLVDNFRRELNMEEGWLKRSFTARLTSGKIVRVESLRFISIANDDIGAIRYSVTPVNFNGEMVVTPYVDGNVHNEDANWEEQFWVPVKAKAKRRSGYVVCETKKTAYQVATGYRFGITQDDEEVEIESARIDHESYAGSEVTLKVSEGQETVIYKYAAVISSLNHDKEDLYDVCKERTRDAYDTGFDALLDEHIHTWAKKWEESDIIIEGDVAAQQGIRFNIFHLNQTYTGEDERLNIGPKGFTGEKYGGSTYWDTEAYCLPFYLATAPQDVARNLLIYRYRHLEKAIENAQKLGFYNGAALYPMVTMNGEESHNEWEITFEEIHRNGAIAYAIYNYIRFTGDYGYLAEYGLEVLIAIARFWAQRVHLSPARGQYVMLGVTGPNEYENNVNNNWYTNYIACWCMNYCKDALDHVRDASPEDYERIVRKSGFDSEVETARWQEICTNMYFPRDEERGIFLQQDNYLDKEQITVAELDDRHKPLNQNWSWDRILRSCFIKQADTLQGFYFFEEHFDKEELRRNFEFYEPRTVHESSLSPCVHVVLAAVLGMEEKAYEMYLRTARLDLDDYNNDTEDGLHITSMAGTWMSVVEGFGGMRVRDGHLHLSPMIPEQWTSYSFRIGFRDTLLKVTVRQDSIAVENLSTNLATLFVKGERWDIDGGEVRDQ